MRSLSNSIQKLMHTISKCTFAHQLCKAARRSLELVLSNIFNFIENRKKEEISLFVYYDYTLTD